MKNPSPTNSLIKTTGPFLAFRVAPEDVEVLAFLRRVFFLEPEGTAGCEIFESSAATSSAVPFMFTFVPFGSVRLAFAMLYLLRSFFFSRRIQGQALNFDITRLAISQKHLRERGSLPVTSRAPRLVS